MKKREDAVGNLHPIEWFDAWKERIADAISKVGNNYERVQKYLESEWEIVHSYSNIILKSVGKECGIDMDTAPTRGRKAGQLRAKKPKRMFGDGVQGSVLVQQR